MRVTITCEECGERMKLERHVVAAERVYLVCHYCETPLKVDIADEQLTKPGIFSRLKEFR